jgi:hypothetical protein
MSEARQREYSWNFVGGGIATVSYPGGLDAEDAADLLALLELVARQIRRRISAVQENSGTAIAKPSD